MKYLLLECGDGYEIANDDADSHVGSVELLKPDLAGPRYLVWAYNPRLEKIDEIAIVKSIDEVVPAIAAYYEENPPRWEPEGDGPKYASNADAPARCGPRYIKETQFGPLWVDQIKPGQWLAYRNDHELLIDDKIAVFTTCEEAQRAADAHLRDGYPNSEIIDDGFSWLPDPNIDRRACSYRVAARAKRLVRNSATTK
jgi:hypothetical protein